MLLKRLEIVGFKSFAQKTILEFDKGISVVVGPNGAGKSNISDALRFVLGEQSMRALRAKKTEDLIFSGSEDKQRLNKAKVTLVFDNTDKSFPIDLSEISIARQIYRDGENKYFINNSQTRLKDLLALTAKAKIGLKGYTIISQGMGDHIISANLKERKEILDEAIGLKEFQLKKNEAKLKLQQTKNNLEKVKGLILELTPNLRFLEEQVRKIKEKREIKTRLEELEKKLFSEKLLFLKKDADKIEDEYKKAKQKISNLEKEKSGYLKKIKEIEEYTSNFFNETKLLESEIFSLESKKTELERELGKIEGMIEAYSETKVEFVPIKIEEVEKSLGEFIDKIKEIEKIKDVEKIKNGILFLKNKIVSLIELIRQGGKKVEVKQEKRNGQILEKKEKIISDLNLVNNQLNKLKEKIKDINNSFYKEKEELFSLRRKLDKSLSEVNFLQNKAEELNAKLTARKQEIYLLEKEEKRALFEVRAFNNPELVQLEREAQRLSIKLEEMELIDEGVENEYKEIKEKMEFLQKEAQDLNEAIKSLEETIKKLDLKMKERFHQNFSFINKSFNKYFKMLFLGGSAKLELVKIESEEEKQIGIDISINLPGKKVSALASLSGGEKTLVSLALLFALASISLPPFMLLDEIDAPLDEANSVRFLQIIDELKDKTQFIIISHNRETMRRADLLYGITMQKKGISTPLSLKFAEALKLVNE